MCGIVGYAGSKPAVKILLNGLEKLEYRGYDSAGLALGGKSIEVIKAKGRIVELRKLVAQAVYGQSIGIGHTRWATHGEPSKINAHPHADCRNKLALVHNGIIENHEVLRELLIKEGHNFKSQTDTEVLVHLIEKFDQGNLGPAMARAMELVEGALAIVVLNKGSNELFAFRRGSPLVVGIGAGEHFFASDVMAVLAHTKQVVYLDENQIVKISPNGYQVWDLKGQPVDPQVQQIKWDVEQITKANYAHFMLKEIHEQPQAVANTLRGRLKNGRIKLTLNIEPKKIRRIILLGCGTSWHSALIGKYLIESLSRINVEVDYASEFRYRQPVLKNGDLVVAISQSGETADTLAALVEAKNKGVKTLGLVNVVGSSIARLVDSGIYLHAGPEIGVASTKAFTCQVTALLLFALYLRQELGEKIPQDLTKELELLPDKIGQVINLNKDLETLASKFMAKKNFLFLGRGIQFPVALEGALKLKEISYIHAEGYPAAEMKHGPIALIDDDMPSFFIAPLGEGFDKIMSNMSEIKSRGGQVIALTNGPNQEIENLSDYLIQVPATHQLIAPIINSIPLQLFAYHAAVQRGLDVDKPRNLAKSVTVE